MDEQVLLGVGSRVNHPAFGQGVVIRLHPIAYEVCFMTYGVRTIPKDYSEWEIIEEIEAEEPVTYTEAEQSLLRILKQWNGIGEPVELGEKWNDGLMILRPGDPSLKEKEIPIDTFFHKIVMVRDRLRVMEQRINASNLTDEEKVGLQQYITRIYGSLTTFNVLFKFKNDHFRGEKTR
ncbi:MAG: hypothetical protein R3330_16120 [Saprospiraceae bacterium]|nr:hypothetical protein [Saprospiraceae bacterium]